MIARIKVCADEFQKEEEEKKIFCGGASYSGIWGGCFLPDGLIVAQTLTPNEPIRDG